MVTALAMLAAAPSGTMAMRCAIERSAPIAGDAASGETTIAVLTPTKVGRQIAETAKVEVGETPVTHPVATTAPEIMIERSVRSENRFAREIVVEAKETGAITVTVTVVQTWTPSNYVPSC